jgi:hypothetical protein
LKEQGALVLVDIILILAPVVQFHAQRDLTKWIGLIGQTILDTGDGVVGHVE